MDKNGILIVDDEKNIRVTMSRALDYMGTMVETAADGQEALRKLETGKFGMVFLDLKMPGMDGADILKIIHTSWPDIRVIIITAHGTVSSAVDAMKTGAVDFIQKPFGPEEIREVADRIMKEGASTGMSDTAESCGSEAEKTENGEAVGAKNPGQDMGMNPDLDQDQDLSDNDFIMIDYRKLIEISRRYIQDKRFNNAQSLLNRALSINPKRPEAYNLLGVLLEINHESLEAQKFYRAALDIGPAYNPAWSNLQRVTSSERSGEIDLGSSDETEEK